MCGVPESRKQWSSGLLVVKHICTTIPASTKLESSWCSSETSTFNILIWKDDYGISDSLLLFFLSFHLGDNCFRFLLFNTLGYVVVQGFRSSPSSNSLGSALKVVRQVDAKYPALLFKQQLTAYVEKIFGIIRDNLKKELTSLLSMCIQVSWILLAAFSTSHGYCQP